jgi:hypothetical protein
MGFQKRLLNEVGGIDLQESKVITVHLQESPHGRTVPGLGQAKQAAGPNLGKAVACRRADEVA